MPIGRSINCTRALNQENGDASCLNWHDTSWFDFYLHYPNWSLVSRLMESTEVDLKFCSRFDSAQYLWHTNSRVFLMIADCLYRMNKLFEITKNSINLSAVINFPKLSPSITAEGLRVKHRTRHTTYRRMRSTTWTHWTCLTRSIDSCWWMTMRIAGRRIQRNFV